MRHVFLLTLWVAFFLPARAAAPQAQFVRISLEGPKRTLALAEVVVMQGDKNLALKGKATQSSMAHGGTADRAIDGNEKPKMSAGGMSHTRDRQPDPWWEVDLGKVQKIDLIKIVNRREGFHQRIDGFALELLDADRKVVFERRGLAAPEYAFEVTFDEEVQLAYLDKKGNRDLMTYVPPGIKDPLPFRFQKNDTVAILGGGLADRMQHHGWVEAALQHAAKDKRVAFRTMAVAGDRYDRFPRSKGFEPMVNHVRRVEADVIFAFFGYNEHYELSPEAYQKGLVSFVRQARSWGQDGNYPRVVLFTPTPREDIGNDLLPDAAVSNEKLAKFAQATLDAAEQAGVAAVDLFKPLQQVMKLNKRHLTLNGIHLNDYGYQILAGLVSEELTGEKVTSEKVSSLLQEAVLDKARTWRARYRALDGNDIWGSRSQLKYADNQTNAQVLQHELEQYDVMTANRDEVVWAAAKGRKMTPQDKDVPAAIPVKTNRAPGIAPASDQSAQRRYLTGEESLENISMMAGLEVSLVADESRFPGLINPVQLQVDAKGRLWVAAWPTYPMAKPGEEIRDALYICEDPDGDGIFDNLKKFATVHCPLGFEFWGDGVIVASQPDLLYLRDTDGDDVADEKTILLQGLGSSDTHHSANNLIMGPDGAIYWLSGIFLQNSYENPHGPPVQRGTPGLYRFDPRSHQIHFLARMGSNPHGISFDKWGYQYCTDGTSGRAFQVRTENGTFKMHQLLDKEVRPVPASEILSSPHFPDEMQQDLLISNAITYLGIKRYDLHRDGFSDKGYKPGEVWGTPTEDFLVSKDRNFRPSDTIIAGDGTLYVSDWHNRLIGHMQHNVRDPQRDQQHGRIFRVTYKGGSLLKNTDLTKLSLNSLLDALKDPTNQVRQRARVQIAGMPATEVVPATKSWINNQSDDHAKLEGFWILHQFHEWDEALATNLASKNVHFAKAIERARLIRTLQEGEKAKLAARPEKAKAPKVQKGGVRRRTDDKVYVQVNAVPESLKFDVGRFKAKAGKTIELTFVNPDHMPHNLVIVKPGTADKVEAEAIALGAAGFKMQFLPKSDDLLVGTKLLDHNGKQTIRFKPIAPGTYPFLCTFPGHGKLMRGKIEVTK